MFQCSLTQTNPTEQDHVHFTPKTQVNEKDYLEWADQIKVYVPTVHGLKKFQSNAAVVKNLGPPGAPARPGIHVAIHPRLPDGRYKNIGYKRETFKEVSRQLFQHRSIIDVMARKSAATIASKTFFWEGHGHLGPCVGKQTQYANLIGLIHYPEVGINANLFRPD
jgi:hypothetical protein